MYGAYWKNEWKLDAHIWDLLFASRKPQQSRSAPDRKTSGTSAQPKPSISRRLQVRGKA